MPEFEITFEVFCKECGAGLCYDSETGYTAYRKTPFVRVPVCETCLEHARRDEYQKAYDDGYQAGTNDNRCL